MLMKMAKAAAKILLGYLLMTTSLPALAEEAFVVLTSYEEHPAWQEEFENPHLLRYDNEVYYSFSVETGEPFLTKTTDEKHYQLFSDMSWLDAIRLIREKNKVEFEWLSKRSIIPEEANIGFASYWVRVQLHVPEGTRVGVENFRFIRPTDKVWVSIVLEELASMRPDDGGLTNGEYHLRMMTRKGVDLKTAIEEAELVCDVTYGPGTKDVKTETIEVLAPYLAEQSYDRPVEVTAMTARKVPDGEVLKIIANTEDYWDGGNVYENCQYLLKKDLWEITALITKETGYPLMGYRWRGGVVGGGWVHGSESGVRYDEEMDLWPEETQREVTFYLLMAEKDSDTKMLKALRQSPIRFEYATECVGDLAYDYIPGPKYQVKVDMSKVEISE